MWHGGGEPPQVSCSLISCHLSPGRLRQSICILEACELMQVELAPAASVSGSCEMTLGPMALGLAPGSRGDSQDFLLLPRESWQTPPLASQNSDAILALVVASGGVGVAGLDSPQRRVYGEGSGDRAQILGAQGDCSCYSVKQRPTSGFPSVLPQAGAAVALTSGNKVTKAAESAGPCQGVGRGDCPAPLLGPSFRGEPSTNGYGLMSPPGRKSPLGQDFCTALC